MTRIRACGFAVLVALLSGCGPGEPGIVTTDPDTAVATTVRITPASVAFSSLGETEAFTAEVLDQDGATMGAAPVAFVSNATSIATVSLSGLVTAVSNGVTTVTATSGAASESAAVTVLQTAISVSTIPSAMTLTGPGSGVQVSATVRDAGGSTISDPDLVWSTNDPDVATVSGDGFITAVAEGTTTVSVEASHGGVSVVTTVAVEVEGGAPTLTITTGSLPDGVENVAYTPVSLDATGGTGGYAWALASASGPLPAGLSLSATGEISGTPTTVGTSTFTVEVTSGAESAQREFEISITGAPQRTVFFTEAFEDTDVVSRGWFGNTSFTLSTAEVYSGSSSLELRYGVGDQTPEFGSAARILFTPSESVYISFRVKYSANWVGSEQAFHPHEFGLLTNEDNMWIGPTSTHLTTLIEHNYQGGVIPKIAMSDQLNIDQSRIGVDLTGVTEDRGASGCNGDADGHVGGCFGQGGGVFTNNKELFASEVALDTSSGPRNQNEWHLVEVFLQLNSIEGGIGQSDGIARYWVDGVPFIDHDDVLFRTGMYPDMEFFEFFIAPYMGLGSPEAQSTWIDDLQIADRR